MTAEEEATGADIETGPAIRPRVGWRLGELAWGLLAAILLYFLLGIVIVGPFAAVYGQDSPEALLAGAIVTALWDAGFVVAVYWLVRRSGGDWRDLGLHLPGRDALPVWNLSFLFGLQSFPGLRLTGRWKTASYLLFSAVSGYATAYFLVAMYSLVINIFGLDFLQPDQQIPEGFFEHDWLVASIGFSVVVTAPAAEEILFRGFLFAGLRRYLGFLPAALLSGFIFSLAHVQPGLIIPFTLVGAVLAYVYQRSGSLLASIGVHFAFNLVSFLVLVFVPGSR